MDIIGYYCYNVSFLEFFEDTIAEEQFEAQKLDIMRDALRSKATYNLETKRMEKDLRLDPPLSPEPMAPLSPDSISSQSPDHPTQNGNVPQNGINACLENGTEPVN